MGKNEYPDEFDPTKEDAFLKNLQKALEPEEYPDEAINIDTQELTSILTIGEEEAAPEEFSGAKEDAAPEELPVIDTSVLYGDVMPLEKEVDDDVIENISNQLASQVGVEYRVQESLRKKKEKPAWLLPTLIASGVFLVGIVVLFASKPGRNFLLAHGIGKLFGDNTTYLPEQGSIPAKAILPFSPVLAKKEPSEIAEPTEPATTVTPEPTAEITPPEVVPPEENTVYHFLVLGMDDVQEGEEVSSDLMLFVTVNAGSGEVKLTTILRDLFVSMPGVGEDKLCLAYARGGIGLVYDTLERNLGIRPDGYLLFSYDKFRSFVDQVGGVTISLTAKEADYLNKTNYISLPENRTMVNGENHLNGDQALGYCRIRHVGTAQNEYNDIGRTARCQRLILALYEQNRTRRGSELYGILTECFRMVTTDITGEECSDYLNQFLNMPESTFSFYRIPAEGSYTTSIIRGKAALVADLAENRAMWQEFLSFSKPQEEEGAVE